MLQNISKIGGKYVRYMVSDGGHNLRRAAILGNYQQVQNCTHWVVGILEKMYSKDENFRAFTNRIKISLSNS